MTQRKDQSSTLFVESSGIPVQFFLNPCTERNNLQPLIEVRGGVVVDRPSNEAITLVLPDEDPPAGSPNRIQVRYVYECVAANRLLPLKDYRFSSMSQGPDSFKAFTLEEDYRILSYIIRNGLFDIVRGQVLWSDLEAQFGNRSRLSLKDRFFMHIIPSLQTYNLPEHFCQLLWRGYRNNPERTLQHHGQFPGNASVVPAGNLQLNKLKSRLVEKLNSSLDSDKCKGTKRSFEDLQDQNCVVSSTELILPGQSGPDISWASLETSTIDPAKHEPGNGICFTSTANKRMLNVDFEQDHSEPEGCLQLDALKNSLVKKLNCAEASKTDGARPASCSDQTLSLMVLEGAKELRDRPEPTGFLERLQARIRDKIQEEIWVDSLVAMVGSLPAKYQKTILDRVQQKLLLSESCSEMLEGRVLENELGSSAVSAAAAAGRELHSVALPGPRTRNCLGGDLASPEASKGKKRCGPPVAIQKDYGEVFFCKTCSFASKSKGTVEIHIKTHKKKGFIRKLDIEENEKCHSGSKDLTCSLCSYRTSLKAQLLLHMGRHITKRRFSCQFCSKDFGCQTSLLVHIQHIHLATFHCRLCRFRARSLRALKCHQLLRHSTRSQTYVNLSAAQGSCYGLQSRNLPFRNFPTQSRRKFKHFRCVRGNSETQIS